MFQFRLRTFIAIVMLLSLLLGVVGIVVRRSQYETRLRQVASHMEDAGATVAFDSQLDEFDEFDVDGRVYLTLAQSKIRAVWWLGHRISADELAELSNLRTLEVLEIDASNLEVGKVIFRLSTLNSLRKLRVDGISFSKDNLRRIQDALPECDIRASAID